MSELDTIRLLSSPAEMREEMERARRSGRKIGFVPTMGFFHEGHLQLMRKAKADCGLCVVSIFVNPIQFGPSEDFAAYPRDLESDLKLAASAGVDYVFHPEPDDMYGPHFQTSVKAGKLSENFCGASRPGHFDGVCTVVAKLFNIVTPDNAYFGMKDYQQLVVIERMAADLNFHVRVIRCETAREKDGLAMSSRNCYLSAKERSIAPRFHEALNQMKMELGIIKNDKNSFSLSGFLANYSIKLKSGGFDSVDYLKVADASTLEEISDSSSLSRASGIFIAGAVYLGRTRLIDNVVFDL